MSIQVLQLLEGKASIYVFASAGCKKWDTCAPEAVLSAAGGKLTDILGQYYRLVLSVSPIIEDFPALKVNVCPHHPHYVEVHYSGATRPNILCMR